MWFQSLPHTAPFKIFLFGLILNLSSQTVLTRLCGCDKLLQSLSVELAQLQMDKVGGTHNHDYLAVGVNQQSLEFDEHQQLLSWLDLNDIWNTRT